VRTILACALYSIKYGIPYHAISTNYGRTADKIMVLLVEKMTHRLKDMLPFLVAMSCHFSTFCCVDKISLLSGGKEKRVFVSLKKKPS
jgi:hypothetical protein